MSAPNHAGRPLGRFGGYDVTLVLPGDQYGRPLDGGGFACTHDGADPMLEFYREGGGGFVSRYGLAMLLCIGRSTYGRDTPRVGLLLDGGTGASIAGDPMLAALRAAVACLVAAAAGGDQ